MVEANGCFFESRREIDGHEGKNLHRLRLEHERGTDEVPLPGRITFGDGNPNLPAVRINGIQALSKAFLATAKAINAKRVKAETLDSFSKALRSRETALTDFDEGLWGTLVDFMTVYGKGDICVTFRDGTEIRMG